MRLVFIYGQVASGKLTIARRLAEQTGFALFHNHLVVDAVSALFPFGSDEFVKLREAMWLDLIGAAAVAGRSMVFTFAPEPTVSSSFPRQVAKLVESAGGRIDFVKLAINRSEQLRRVANDDRAAFGKLRSADLLKQLWEQFDASLTDMPPAVVMIDTASVDPAVAVGQIRNALQL